MSVALSAAMLVGGSTAANAEEAVEEVPVTDLSAAEGLSADQLAAIESFQSEETADAAATTQPVTSGRPTVESRYSRRAVFYRGTFLLWTRDNVDFGYNFSSVTWSSAFQEAGASFPNTAKNKGITKFYDTVRNDQFRAQNTIGIGVPTPWGSIKLYTKDYTHYLSVNHNGAWSGWS